MILFKKRSARGFTLVELMIVVAIIGILAALAIVGVKKYMTNAKSAEARNSLGTMSNLAAQAWTGENMAGAMLDDKTGVGTTHTLCPTALKSVPENKTSIAGKKYQSSTAAGEDFHAAGGWTCLGFTLESPQYYMYSYSAPTATTFNTVAEGDLNGNGDLSNFSRPGEVKNDQMKMSPAVIEVNPDE